MKHGPEELRVSRDRVPQWFRKVLNGTFPNEIREYLCRHSGGIKRTKLHSGSEAVNFVLNCDDKIAGRPQCLVGLFDHFGFDKNENFVCEPYAGPLSDPCPHDFTQAKEFSRKTGLRFEVSDKTYHAPEHETCLRFTFFKPEEL